MMLVKREGKDSKSVTNALIRNARKLPQELYKSLTWNRDTGMHGQKRFTVATDIQVYFCHPQSPWQRGSNENNNGLLRHTYQRASTSRATHSISSTRPHDNLAKGSARRLASMRPLKCSANVLR